MSEKDDPFGHTRMSLAEHLEELRVRLIKGTLAIAVAFAVAFAFQDGVRELVTRPYRQAMDMLREHYVAEAEAILAADPGRPRTDFFVSEDPADDRLLGMSTRLTAIKPAEPFLFTLKVCFYASLVFGAPVLLWQMWGFVSAGLYEREKRAVRTYFPLSVLAFAVGVAFGFLVIVPYGMYFLNKAASIEEVVPNVTVQEFLTFLSGLCLVFGAVFQLPLLMTFLSTVGLLEPSTVARYRGHFVVGAFVVAAVLTPPDPFTQLMMAIPLIVLFELGLVSSRVAVRRRSLP